MQPTCSNFSQPPNKNPNLPPTSFPPSQALYPSQSLPPTHFTIQQPTPTVPFAALSDPIILFDVLDHTYPPEKFLAHSSAPSTLQLGPQPLDQQSYLTWHSRRLSLLYYSLTGTASNWYDRLPQVYKSDRSSFLKIFIKQFHSENHAYHAQIEALLLVKKDNENNRHFALKVELLLSKNDVKNVSPPSILNAMKFSLVVFLKS